MKIETVESMLESASYDFEIDYESEGDNGIEIGGTWIVDGERRRVDYGIADLYKDCGGEMPCAPCEGGLAVFDTVAERDNWLKQV